MSERHAEAPDEQERRVEHGEDDEDRAREHEVLAEEVDGDQDEAWSDRRRDEQRPEVRRAGCMQRPRLVEAEEVEDAPSCASEHLEPVMVHLGEAERRAGSPA